MKTNKFWLVAALTATFVLAGCENKAPFDTQSADDQPRILVPYETTDGKIHGTVYNPAPYVDSVIVTPSAYTTVNWYLDNTLVYTGTHINMNFPTGTYDLLIEAVTTAGKRTTRTGDLTVRPAATDPYSGAPAAGRHFVPNTISTISGTNLTQVVKIILSKDLYAKEIVCTIDVSTADDASLSFTLPDLADGKYYLRLKDAKDNLYGADAIEVHNASVALAGYETFVPGQEWVITGAKLENVASVKVDETVITDITKTSTSITLIAPEAAVGEHTLSITNEDGSKVFFLSAGGMVTEVTTIVSAETTLWNGPQYILWDADRVRVESSVMADVPVGSTIYIYYEELPEGHEGYIENGAPNVYHKMQLITATWTTLIDGFDVTSETPNPYTFTLTEDMKSTIANQYSMSVVGWGLFINKITFK